jgi:hypothetical protein
MALQWGKRCCSLRDTFACNIVGCPKFMPRYIGPFKVTKEVNRVAFELELPDTMKVHNVFHVSLLKPWIPGGRYTPPPPVVFVDGQTGVRH